MGDSGRATVVRAGCFTECSYGSVIATFYDSIGRAADRRWRVILNSDDLITGVGIIALVGSSPGSGDRTGQATDGRKLVAMRNGRCPAIVLAGSHAPGSR